MPSIRPNIPKPVGRPVMRNRATQVPAATKHPLHNRNGVLNHGAPPGFVSVKPRTIDGSGKDDITVYAVVGTWYEGDIIEATIKSCFANGCKRVYIVDNQSPDDTCAVAKRNGAVIARSYKTDYYDDDLRLRLMNEVTKEVTETEKLPQVWWLALDADEFPCGPHGESIKDYLSTLSFQVNCVGCNAIDLYPTDPPHYTPGMHPADCQEKGLRRANMRGVNCPHGHWKHPLLRYDHGQFHMAQSRGCHHPFVLGDKAYKPTHIPTEPVDPLIMFHCPMRARERTFERLKALCDKQEGLHGGHRSSGDDAIIQAQGAIKRWRSFEYIYNGEWDKVELPHAQIYGGNVTGIALFPWRRLLPNVRHFPRWYPAPGSAPKIELPMA